MPKHTAIELFFVATGLAATLIIVSVAAWAYPLARREIEVSGWVIAAIVVALGIAPVRRAWLKDRHHG
ncbi:hypothetical protein ACFSC3_02305 [Sphingomonas floccifaciens]|uniref:Uncharacterized protein n=1 Tax=Sphingomonas floccifaciens TaxID=1844115 RepID=A0ABW4N9A9_9SPHN